MENKNLNSYKFLSIYNYIDRFMRNELNKDDNVSHTILIEAMSQKNTLFKRYRKDLKLFANLRNAIVHNQIDIHTLEAIAELNNSTLELYESIKNDIFNPPKALDKLAIKKSNIFFVDIEQNALDVMTEMKEFNYSHVPVLDSKKFIGVFSESTIFSYTVSNKYTFLEDDTKIKEFIDFIPIDNHESESFKFISRDKTVYDVEEIFKKELDGEKRLSAVFISETGKNGEGILGMITAWDIAGYKNIK